PDLYLSFRRIPLPTRATLFPYTTLFRSGYLKPGRYLDYIDWDGRAYFSQEDGNVIKGIPHNRFLVTALQAMGLSPEDYERDGQADRKSTRLNSSHVKISYAVFCLKQKKS